MARDKQRDEKQVDRPDESAQIDKDTDALFGASLSEFVSERNALAARLKRAGRAVEAEQIKTTDKPSVSAWAVNQLYRMHRDAFDRLLEAGARVRDAQAAQMAGTPTDLRKALDTKRTEAVKLAGMATALLRSAGQSATPETIRRIATTLEALSVRSFTDNDVLLGRLTRDLEPPGFEALAALAPTFVAPTRKPAQDSTSRRTDAGKGDNAGIERKTAARALLLEAENAVAAARSRVEVVETDLNAARKLKEDAEERLNAARASAKEADIRVRDLSAEFAAATKALKESELAFNNASREAHED